MKKAINICLLLLSLVGCSNNIVNNSSTSTCSCVKSPIDQSSKLTFKSVTNIGVEDIVSIYGYHYYQSFRTEIKQEDFEKFYSFVNREYTKVENTYLKEKFRHEINAYESYRWYMNVNNHYFDIYSILSEFDEEKNYYFIILGAKESYLSIPITPEEMKEFPST